MTGGSREWNGQDYMLGHPPTSAIRDDFRGGEKATLRPYAIDVRRSAAGAPPSAAEWMRRYQSLRNPNESPLAVIQTRA